MANLENQYDYEDEILEDDAVLEAKDDEEDEKSKKMKSKSDDSDDDDDEEDEDKEVKEGVKYKSSGAKRFAGERNAIYDPKNVGNRSYRAPGKASKSDLSALAASATAQFLGKGGKITRKEEYDLEEGTLAADSLKPAARSVSDDKAITSSKISMMQHMMGTMNSMKKTDLIDFFNKTMSQFGPNKDYGVGNKSGHNQDSIDTTLGKGPKTKDPMPRLKKLNVREDVEEMFNGQDLTEDFKDNVATLFEAAINARLTIEEARLEEEYEAQINEEIAIFKEEMTSKLDTYLDYVVENWMKENEVAIESTLRNELAEEFIDGLKNLFAEHYISVPEEQVDVLEAMAEKIAVLEERLDESITVNSELHNMVLEGTRQDIFVELASDLALTQQEKFAALAEGIEFDGDLDTYAHKLSVIKENYFNHEAPAHSSNIEEETFEGTIAEETRNIDPMVGRYAQAIARTIKK